MKKLFLIFSFLALSFTGSFVYHIYTTQDAVIFKSIPLEKGYVYEWDHPFQELYLETLEHTEINALWFQTKNPKGVVLFFHGRGKNLAVYGKRATPFIEKGYDVFIIDYRGFGKSSNGFKENWILEDGDTAYHFLLQHYKENEIIVYGHSLGTSIATWVASHHNPRMLILEAPFYNMISVASHTKPLIPEWLIQWVLRYHLHTDQWINKVQAPIYIFHGIPDTVIPYEHSQKLFAKIKHHSKNELLILPEAGHNNIHHDPLYQEKLEELLP